MKLLLLAALLTFIHADAQEANHQELMDISQTTTDLAKEEADFLKRKLHLGSIQYDSVLEITTAALTLYNRAVQDLYLQDLSTSDKIHTATQLQKLILKDKSSKIRSILNTKQWDIYQGKKEYITEQFWPEMSL